MTKTKAQLRAEAVERLKKSEYHTALDDVRSMLGWGHEPHFEVATDALVDLLTDDCGPCYSCAKLAELRAENSQLRVKVDKQAEVLDLQQELPDERDVEATTKSSEKDGNDGETSDVDSREKLEADVRQYANPSGSKGTLGACWEKQTIEFLNRQAAITEDNCKELVGAQAERIAELEELLQRTNRRISVQGSRIHALEAGSPTSECRACFDAMQEEKYRIKLERDEANTKKHELAAERDELRAAYDELTTIAAQLCRACGFTMVDVSGEVVE